MRVKVDRPHGCLGDLHRSVRRREGGQATDRRTSSRTMLPWRVVALMVAVAGVADSPTTRNVAAMLPFREFNLAVGAPIVMLRMRRGLRSVRCAIIVCMMEGPEDRMANGSSSQEPGEERVVRIGRRTSDGAISHTPDGFEHRGHVYAISWNAGLWSCGRMHVSRLRRDYNTRRSRWARVSR